MPRLDVGEIHWVHIPMVHFQYLLTHITIPASEHTNILLSIHSFYADCMHFSSFCKQLLNPIFKFSFPVKLVRYNVVGMESCDSFCHILQQQKRHDRSVRHTASCHDWFHRLYPACSIVAVSVGCDSREKRQADIT